jgi:hypothetical protein
MASVAAARTDVPLQGAARVEGARCRHPMALEAGALLIHVSTDISPSPPLVFDKGRGGRCPWLKVALLRSSI